MVMDRLKVYLLINGDIVIMGTRELRLKKVCNCTFTTLKKTTCFQSLSIACKKQLCLGTILRERCLLEISVFIPFVMYQQSSISFPSHCVVLFTYFFYTINPVGI